MTKLERQIKLRQLAIIAEIYKSGNIRSAAANLGLTAPAVSKACREVEDIVGDRLFDRTRSGMIPRNICNVIVRSSDVINSELRKLSSEIEDKLFNTPHSLNIGYQAPSLVRHAMRAAGALRNKFPNLRLRILQFDRGILLEGIATDKFDIAIVDLYQINKYPGLLSASLIKEPCYAVSPSSVKSINEVLRLWDEYRMMNWILPVAGFSLRDRFEALIASKNLYLPSNIIEVNQASNIRPLLEKCNAITLATREILMNEGVRNLPPAQNDLSEELIFESGAVWREYSPNIDMIREYCDIMEIDESSSH
ncbi:LysR family transcriptional regulator [Asaia sp. HN010]|uniref:LysR family transcriptional regulator n=1 Tax=Asaia sp. HN010 TaxID=3081233 RepID=UPI0030172AB0